MDYLVLTKSGGMILGPVSTILGGIMDALFRFTSTFGVLNIGLCIILFTLVVKLLMIPMTIKQQKSSKLMAVMQPELQAIQEKYKGKTDQDSMMRMNVETKAVYEKYGTSMTGGCLPLLIQMPILFALYRVIYNIPAYVASVKVYFMQVVYAITGVTNAAAMPEGAAEKLMQFATEHGVSMNTMPQLGDLTGLSGEALANKMVDILYKFNPTHWVELGNAFPDAAATIAENSTAIESMNSFMGMNLAMNPFQGFTNPNILWLIPILAGLTQWYSARQMMANQSQPMDENSTSGQMMKSMNTMMPLMSVFFCFTFPAAVGIYWVASSALQIVQQWIINAHLNKVDIDEMVKKNLEKANAKRAKQGLPPQKINQNPTAVMKNMQAAQERDEANRAAKVEKSREQMKESSAYYNQDAKPGSLAAKAGMVAKYNEKHEKK